MFSMSGLQVRVGYGFRYDVFPGAALRGEDRMMEGEGGVKRPVASKDLTVDDFFSNEPPPAVSFK